MESYITSLYGMRFSPIYHEDRFHDGIDIYGEVGDDIRAIYDGIVTEVYFSESFGNVLKYKLLGIDENIEVRYAHLDSSDVKVGDRIEKGEVVAKCGETGKVTGPHLHFSVFLDGEAIDPIEIVELDCIEGLEQ